MTTLRYRVALACMALGLALPSPAMAQQDYPNHVVRVIVPFGAGGPTDVFTRVLAEELRKSLKQGFVMENRPGAGTVIGTAEGAKSPPDGYTLVMVSATQTVNETLVPNKPYQLMRDFVPVAMLFRSELVMVVHPSVPANNVKEFIALAKAKPGELNFASSGIGAAAHLTMEMFKSRTGINMQHIPYKGTAGALQDTVGGQINVMFDIVGPLMPQVRSGNVKALVVTAKERIPAASDVPTMAEQGVPDFVSGTWAGIIAPAGTPKEIVDRIAAEAKKALADPAMKDKLAEQGIVAVGSTPEEFRAFVAEEIPRWSKVITDAGIKME